MKRTRTIFCVILALLMLVSLFACSKSSGKPADTTPAPASSDTPADTSPAVTKPDTVNIGVSSYLGTFLDGTPPPNSMVGCSAVYDSIFLIDPATKEPYSDILTEWKYTDDTTFVMTLKDGVTFSNGDVATAEDLLYSIINHMDRPGDSQAIWLGEIDVENCYTEGNNAILKWKTPWGPGITGTTLYLMDKAWIEAEGWDSMKWYNDPNGSGPYKVVEYVNDNYFTLTLKDNYWNAANVQFDVKNYKVTYYADGSTLYMALEKGDIDLCGVSNIADYSRWKDSGNKDIAIKDITVGDNLLCFIASEDNPMFSDIAVRKAIALGVDWAAIGQMIQGDLYHQPTSIFVDDSPYYKNVGAYEFNQEAAKQALADAGYKEGDLYVHMKQMSSDSYKTMSEAVQFYLNQIGIKCDVEYGDVTSMLTEWQQHGTNDMGFFSNVYGVIDCEPHKSLNSYYLAGFTWCKEGDQTAIDMCLDALHTVDRAARIAKYQEFQQYAHDNYLIFPIAASTAMVGYRTSVFTDEEMTAHTYTSSYVDLQGLGRVGV